MAVAMMKPSRSRCRTSCVKDFLVVEEGRKEVLLGIINSDR